MWTATLFTFAAFNLACGNVFLALALSVAGTVVLCCRKAK